MGRCKTIQKTKLPKHMFTAASRDVNVCLVLSMSIGSSIGKTRARLYYERLFTRWEGVLEVRMIS